MLPSSGRFRYYTHGYWPKFEAKQVWQSEVTPTKYRMVSCGDWKKWLQRSPSVWCQRPEGPAVVTDCSLREVQLHQGILDLRVVNWLKCFCFGSSACFARLRKRSYPRPLPHTFLPPAPPPLPPPQHPLLATSHQTFPSQRMPAFFPTFSQNSLSLPKMQLIMGLG